MGLWECARTGFPVWSRGNLLASTSRKLPEAIGTGGVLRPATGVKTSASGTFANRYQGREVGVGLGFSFLVFSRRQRAAQPSGEHLDRRQCRVIRAMFQASTQGAIQEKSRCLLDQYFAVRKDPARIRIDGRGFSGMTATACERCSTQAAASSMGTSMIPRGDYGSSRIRWVIVVIEKPPFSMASARTVHSPAPLFRAVRTHRSPKRAHCPVFSIVLLLLTAVSWSVTSGRTPMAANPNESS